MERLCLALYGRKPRCQDYLGGANAKMLHDAATAIEAANEMPTLTKAKASAAIVTALAALARTGDSNQRLAKAGLAGLDALKMDTKA